MRNARRRPGSPPSAAMQVSPDTAAYSNTTTARAGPVGLRAAPRAPPHHRKTRNHATREKLSPNGRLWQRTKNRRCELTLLQAWGRSAHLPSPAFPIHQRGQFRESRIVVACRFAASRPFGPLCLHPALPRGLALRDSLWWKAHFCGPGTCHFAMSSRKRMFTRRFCRLSPASFTV